MSSIEERLSRLEEAILAVADLRDPAQLEFPVTSSDPRARKINEAEHRLAELADKIRADRNKQAPGHSTTEK